MARDLRQKIAKLSRAFPQDERYRLTDQIIRSSRSIPANIAEGFGRFHFQENVQYCRQSRGSLMETLEHLYCAYDEKYITAEQLREYQELIRRCGQLINGYIAYLTKAKHVTRVTNNG